MRNIDPILKSRQLAKQQTLYNNANPSMEVIAVRARTPITRKELWQELVITESATAVCTSVAVKKTGRTPERVYAAYVDSTGLLTVKSAAVRMPIRLMTWQVETTIADCVACALEFNGEFVKFKDYQKEYWTDELPWLFFITTSGALMAGVLGGPYDAIAAANVTALDAIYGVRSLYGDTDQGMIVFYILSGSLYYNQYIDGVWVGQQTISTAPAVCTAVKAERTFDWRIIVQIRDDVGKLYEIISKPAISGHTNLENLTAHAAMSVDVYEVDYIDTKSTDEQITAMASMAVTVLWGISPIMISAWNIDNGSGDYGYKVRLVFDHDVANVTGNDTAFLLTDSESRVFNSTAVLQISSTELEIEFQNFNNTEGDITLAYTPGTIVGEAGQTVDADTIVFTPNGLVPTITPPPVPLSAINIIDWSVT